MAKKGIDMIVKPTIKQVKAEHARRTKKLSKMKKPNARISVFLDRWVQKNFKGEGENVGGWKPFKAGGRWIRGKGLDTSAKLLQDTGRLRASFIPFATALNAGIGSDLSYSKPHDEGLDGLPMRRMLPKKAEVKEDIRKIYDGHVRESIK